MEGVDEGRKEVLASSPEMEGSSEGGNREVFIPS